MNFYDRIIGPDVLLYWVDITNQSFRLDDNEYRIISYTNGDNSTLGDITNDICTGIQDPKAIVKVRRHRTDGTNTYIGYSLIDIDTNHLWLEFGTVYRGTKTRFYFQYRTPKIVIPKPVCTMEDLPLVLERME